MWRNLPDIRAEKEKLYARKLWADFSHPEEALPLKETSKNPSEKRVVA